MRGSPCGHRPPGCGWAIIAIQSPRTARTKLVGDPHAKRSYLTDSEAAARDGCRRSGPECLSASTPFPSRPARRLAQVSRVA